MSLIANQTNINQDKYFFLLVDAKVVTTSTIVANTGIYDSVYANNISSASVTASTISTFNLVGYNNYLDYIQNIVINTNLVNLDSNGLTASNGSLYINGVLVATPSDVGVDKWANFKAVANIDANYSTIKNVAAISTNYISSGIIGADTINAIGGNITTLIGNQMFYNQGRIIDMSNDTINTLNINTSSIYTDYLISKSILNEFEISSYSVSASLGEFDVGNIKKLDTLNLSNAYNISTNSLYAEVAQINTLLSVNISTNSVSQNISRILPSEGNDGNILFQDNQNNIRGALLLGNNTSSFTIATPNELLLIGQSTAKLSGYNGMVLETDRITYTEYINLNTNIVNINSGELNTNAYMSTNVITADLILANIADFKVLNASTITFDLVTTNNINNSSNINTATLDVSGNASINNLTANGLTVNNSADYNSYISFGTSNSGIYGAQYLYDINSLRNLQVEKITVLGGWTGDDIVPPYYNDSIVEIGEDAIRPGQVTINGFNPDPLDTGTALTVRGDTQITQNLNVLGLTTLEGVVETIGDLNVDGALTVEGTTDLVGITTVTGFTNLLGGLEVTGETNFLGAVTAEAGIGVIGAVGVTLGDVVFGSAINTGNSFTNYGTTYLSNTNIGGTLSTNYIVVTTLPDTGDTGIVFANSNSVGKGVIQGNDNTLLIVGTENVDIGAISSLTIQSGSNATFGGTNDTTIAGISSLFLFTPSTIRITANEGIFDIPQGITTQAISTLASVTGLGLVDELRANTISTGSITSENININSISTGVIRVTGISTNTISSGVIRSDAISTNNISSGFLYSGVLSTLQANASSINAGYATLNNLSGAGNITNTNSLYPLSATSQLGFFGALGTTSGGWYNTLNARSTNTQVITPDSAGAFSNILTLRGFVSTQSINSSTITSSNIFTSSLRATSITTSVQPTVTNSSANPYNFVSTGIVRTTWLIPNPTDVAVITQGLQPLNSAQTIGLITNPYNTAFINIMCNNNLSSGTIVGGSINVSSVRANTVTGTSTIFTSSLLATTINTNTGLAGTFVTGYDYVSSATIRTNTLIGSGAGNSVITFGLQPINNIQNLANTGVPYNNCFLTSTFSRFVSTGTLITGVASTQSLVVSTINNKTYPYTSTLSVFPGGVSTFSFDGTLAVTPQVMISNITFPTLGNYLITSKMTVSKSAGGAGAEPYGSLCLSRGLFPSTFATQDGFNSIPYLNAINKSTFNTYTTSVSITDNAQLSRFLTYYDQTGHNYTIKMAIADFRIRYLPGNGNLPDTGIS